MCVCACVCVCVCACVCVCVCVCVCACVCVCVSVCTHVNIVYKQSACVHTLNTHGTGIHIACVYMDKGIHNLVCTYIYIFNI